MQEPDDDKIEMSRLEYMIGQYVIEHPQAADTAEGVANWWLADSGINAANEKVLQALENLVQNGLLDKCKLHDGSSIYALAARKH